MILWYILSQKFHRSKVDCKVLIDYGIIMNYKLIYLCFLHTLLTMTSLAEKRRGSSLSSSLIVDTLLISKLFTPLCQYVVSLGSIIAIWENSLRMKLKDFSVFSCV